MTPAQAFLATLGPFTPKRWLKNGHAMTIHAWARPRPFPDLPTPEARTFEVDTNTRVLAHCYWQPNRAGAPTLVALHGLEGSSAAHYMQGLADKAWRRGWNAVLLNQRNCGGTEHLTPGLYHSGLTADPLSVIRELADADHLPVFGIVGYSLGGNLAVRIAGELGGDSPLPVAGVVAVSPTIDLAACVTAIERKANFPYQWNFVRNLKNRMRRKLQTWPGSFDAQHLDRLYTIRRFDDVYTAPSHGFEGADDYYFRASALRLVDRIRIPTLILTAANDPFVPPSQFRDPAIQANPNIGVRIERFGGHCGFVSNDDYWAESTAISFLAGVMAK